MEEEDGWERGAMGKLEARNAVEDGIFLERERRNHELNSKLVFPSFCRGLLSRVRWFFLKKKTCEELFVHSWSNVLPRVLLETLLIKGVSEILPETLLLLFLWWPRPPSSSQCGGFSFFDMSFSIARAYRNFDHEACRSSASFGEELHVFRLLH